MRGRREAVLRGALSIGRRRRAPHRARRWPVARWRLLALLGVHLLIAAHLLHHAYAGQTLGRVVLADAHLTIERGIVNPAFVLFALALAATALFGRFFCGWACHMGALQDASAWLLRRAGIRPRLFRSRLLGYAPLLLALYLFVWPSVLRDLVHPWLATGWPAAAAALQPIPPFPGWSTAWTSRDLWTGLPGPFVAVPFLLVCGAATVYFLGARGLCRYACPYGGLLRPAARLAPVRVVVDPDRCDGCARCTAACSIGVRVHEQTRDHGSVIDADCMRTLDCIEACPQQALSLRALAPAEVETTPQATLGWRTELFLAVIALGSTLVRRGLYDRIPLLLAAALGVLVAFLALRGAELAQPRMVTLAPFLLRDRSGLRRAGRVYLALLVISLLLLAQSALVQGALLRARILAAQVYVDWAQIQAHAVDPAQAALARRALAWYRIASPPSAGGLALATTPEVPLRRAWLLLVLGESQHAERELRARLETAPTDTAARAALAELLQSR
ncbi:MAG: 4Fe-4S binding protein [Xanthomonadales bacterium]|nr:4Fe-4S binding protein [Xanthomonadales bacterium]